MAGASAARQTVEQDEVVVAYEPSPVPVVEAVEEAISDEQSESDDDSFEAYDDQLGVFAFDEEEVRRHLPLVRQVVQRMLPRKPSEVPLDDLLSWGTLGLLDAFRKYDKNREASFPTYAQYRIRGAILDFLRRCDWLPRSMRQKAHDLEAATSRLESQLGRSPDNGELAGEMALSLEELAHIQTQLGTGNVVTTAEISFGHGDDTVNFEEVVADTKELGPAEMALEHQRVDILTEAIETLPEKERFVISLYYFEGLTMRELAEALGLTEGRISQLHSQAMRRLRTALEPCRPELCYDA